nr:hypothetical protein [Sphingomonadaceae bacterium]
DMRALDRYRQVTRVEPRCNRNPSGSEITVCGNRRADRWRVPFIGYGAGDPRGEGVSAERNRLASAPPVKCGEGAFLGNCGMVGVDAGVRPASGKLRVRPLAP